MSSYDSLSAEARGLIASAAAEAVAKDRRDRRPIELGRIVFISIFVGMIAFSAGTANGYNIPTIAEDFSSPALGTEKRAIDKLCSRGYKVYWHGKLYC